MYFFWRFQFYSLSFGKQGGDYPSDACLSVFRNFVSSCDFLDLDFIGPCFTWKNRRQGDANIVERLDRVLSTYQWNSCFPHAMVEYLDDK